jgi:hypothetical protein
VNLQDNSALVQIDTETAEIKRIDGYGLKPINNGIGFDIVEDGGCDEIYKWRVSVCNEIT